MLVALIKNIKLFFKLMFLIFFQRRSPTVIYLKCAITILPILKNFKLRIFIAQCKTKL